MCLLVYLAVSSVYKLHVCYCRFLKVITAVTNIWIWIYLLESNLLASSYFPERLWKSFAISSKLQTKYLENDENGKMGVWHFEIFLEILKLTVFGNLTENNIGCFQLYFWESSEILFSTFFNFYSYILYSHLWAQKYFLLMLWRNLWSGTQIFMTAQVRRELLLSNNNNNYYY